MGWNEDRLLQRFDLLCRKIKLPIMGGTFEALPRCVVGEEAYNSAHFVSRTLRCLGFDTRIIPAIYVRPLIKGQKNDFNDAKAIAGAALRLNLKIVTEKSQDKLGCIGCDQGCCPVVRQRLIISGRF
ncbi:hypothetical protein CLV88_1284 [Shimia abyssi]|uniref:Transposase n=1 Tax=Shimia abyssi TaxID=1662395 RepID=A0A2P8EYI4_9RHOB|nr:hypothetical protein CLV88_1284 [Shimia abyssi]